MHRSCAYGGPLYFDLQNHRGNRPFQECVGRPYVYRDGDAVVGGRLKQPRLFCRNGGVYGNDFRSGWGGVSRRAAIGSVLRRRADSGNEVDFIETHPRAVFTGVSRRQFHWRLETITASALGGEDVQRPEDVLYWGAAARHDPYRRRVGHRARRHARNRPVRKELPLWN